MCSKSAGKANSVKVCLPEELIGDPPRQIPATAKEGPLEKSRNELFWLCLLSGSVCIGLSWLPVVDHLALYFLPFGYLSPIGLALCCVSGACLTKNGEVRKAHAYVQHGKTGFAEVKQLLKSPTVVINGQPAHYAFHAELDMPHPASGESCQLEVKSRDFSADLKDRIDTRFRVGDEVPIVWMSGSFEETCQIYDFVELTPQSSLVRQESTLRESLGKLVLAILVLVSLFSVLIWNLWAFGRYSPLDFDYATSGLVPLVLGGTIGFVACIGCWLWSRHRQTKLAARNVESALKGQAIELTNENGLLHHIGFNAVILAGSVLICSITMLCWFFTANALLDDSQPRIADASITELEQTTHSFVFRDYKIHYRMDGVREDQEFLTTPQHLAAFDGQNATVKIRSGWLDWPWVEGVEPAN